MGMKLAGALLIVIAVMAGGFYLYYTDSQKKIAILTENAAKAELAVQTQKAAISAMEENMNKQAQLVGDLTSKLSDAESGYKKLAYKLQDEWLQEKYNVTVYEVIGINELFLMLISGCHSSSHSFIPDPEYQNQN